jgi:hypothetical protein
MTMYAVIDYTTKNILGEFATPEEAEEMFHELVVADAHAEEHVRVVAADEPLTPTGSLELFDAPATEAEQRIS